MTDDHVNPRIMASTTVRPTLVVADPVRSSTDSHELTAGISSEAHVKAAVLGTRLKAATRRLEAVGFQVRVVSRDGQPDQEPAGGRGECANLSIVDDRVADLDLQVTIGEHFTAPGVTRGHGRVGGAAGNGAGGERGSVRSRSRRASPRSGAPIRRGAPS